MQLVLNEIEPEARIVISPGRPMTDDEFWDFCQDNPDLRIERTAEGEIEIMPPTGGESGDSNDEVSFQLRGWAKRDRRGKTYNSSTGFILPNGATRSPDASWVERSRIAALTRAQMQRFVPLCPDFVVELTSPTDRLKKVQAKMREYMENGAKLGWLLDVHTKTVYVYRPGRDVERIVAPDSMVGEVPIDGFALDLTEVWDPS
jgi:Uma2 family endonuclease